MNVSAIIVTRGDVDLKPVVTSLPEEWDVLVWNNGEGGVYRRVTEGGLLARIVTGKGELPDLSVYGRYAAIEYTDAELILTQDDDVVVSDPQAIVNRLRISRQPLPEEGVSIMDPANTAWRTDIVVCNMPPEFRHDFYRDHALVGFGAAFHRDAPARAFAKMLPAIRSSYRQFVMSTWLGDALASPPTDDPATWPEFFRRTCDIVFTALTPRVLVDVPKTNLPWADTPDRMYRQPDHQIERARVLDLVREIR